MQLQKLVYLAHGWNLAVNNKELVEDEFEAWDFGPVIRKLYDALRKYGNGPVSAKIKWGDDSPFPGDDRLVATSELLPDQIAVIDDVWVNYGGFDAYQLSALTHASNTPWKKNFEKGKNKVIDNFQIWDYFADLAAAS